METKSFVTHAFHFNNAITTSTHNQAIYDYAMHRDRHNDSMHVVPFLSSGFIINSFIGIWIHHSHPVGPTMSPRRLHQYFMAHDVMDRLHPHGPTINVTVRSHPTRAHDRYLQDSQTGIHHKPLLMSTMQ